jgi:hypothetical protein
MVKPRRIGPDAYPVKVVGLRLVQVSPDRLLRGGLPAIVAQAEQERER